MENAVGAHLLGTLAPAEHAVTYWRDGADEVDFVVARGLDVWAIEVKSGRSGKVGGLRAFLERYPGARGLIVGGPGIPLGEFFGRPAGAWLVG